MARRDVVVCDACQCDACKGHITVRVTLDTFIDAAGSVDYHTKERDLCLSCAEIQLELLFGAIPRDARKDWLRRLDVTGAAREVTALRDQLAQAALLGG